MVRRQIAQETYPTAPLRAHLSHLALSGRPPLLRSTHPGLSATSLHMLFQFAAPALLPVLKARRSPGPSPKLP